MSGIGSVLRKNTLTSPEALLATELFPSLSLIPILLTHNPQQRFAGDEAADVFAIEPPLPVAGACGLAADVGADDDVRQFPQRVVLGQRFRIGHVHAGAGDLFLLEG